MPVLISCVSDKPIIEYRTITYVPTIYFPKFPDPKEGVILPFDADLKRVTDNNTEIVYVVVPYWYWQQIVEYKDKVDKAEIRYNALQ